MTIMVMAIAIIGIVGIRASGERLLGKAHVERTAAGASQAAATELAEIYFEWQLARYDDDQRERRPLAALMSDAATLERARAAANEIAAVNALGRANDVKVTCDAHGVIVTVTIGRQEAQSDFPAPECFPR